MIADRDELETKQTKFGAESSSSNLQIEPAIKSKVDEIYEKRKREILGQSQEIGTTDDPEYDIYEKRRKEVLSDSFDIERYPTDHDQYRPSARLLSREYSSGRGIYFVYRYKLCLLTDARFFIKSMLY